MTLDDIARIGAYVIGSVGGAGLILVALARWFGKVLSRESAGV